MIRLAILLCLLPCLAQAACRQALSLGVDVSSSVDDAEYRLQLDGIAAALTSEAVRGILLQQPDAPVRIHVYTWSGPDDQQVVVPWTAVTGEGDLATITQLLRDHRRQPGDDRTAIGSAMLQGFSYLAQQGDCWKRTLDLSGDGPTNTGLAPENVPESARPGNTTVNALVIGSGDRRGDDERFADIKELSSYYRTRVIRGPDAFVEVALGYDDYAAAMERKLLRELVGIVIGGID